MTAKQTLQSVSVFCFSLTLAGCTGPQRFRTPAPAEDRGPLIAEPVLGKCAGHATAAREFRVMEWVAKRTWHVLGLPYEREDFKGPPDLGGVRKWSGCTEITGTVANVGVPLRNQIITCEVEQRGEPILVLLRSTDAFGEVLIELDLLGGTARVRSVTVSRSMIGGESHSSPMPEQSSSRIVAESKFPPQTKGWNRIKVETRGEWITVWVSEYIGLALPEWQELFRFWDPDPAGGKFGFGSTGTVMVRNVEQQELISPAESQRRAACLREMHAFCKGLDAGYDRDVRKRNEVDVTDAGVTWTWPATGATATFEVDKTRVHGTVKAGLHGNDVLVDGVLPQVEVTARNGRVFRADPAKPPVIEADALGVRMALPLCDDTGRTATAHVHARFTVLPVWWWTITVEGVTPKRIQAFVGIAPAFAPRVDASAEATRVPNIADESIRESGVFYRHNTRVGVLVKTIVPDTVIGARVGGRGDLAVSIDGERLRFASLWLPAQPLNKIGFGKRMVHYIKYPEGPVEHWRRRPSHQEYPTDTDLRRFAGHGCEAMVWHHTWISTDYRDREAFLVNAREMQRAMDEMHRLGMAAIGYIGILPGRSSLLRWEDATADYAKNWDLQDFTFYGVAGRWQEFLPWMTDYWCREYRLDGYYADGALAVASRGRLTGPLHPEDADLSLDELQHRLYYRVKKVLERHGARFGLEQWGGSRDMLVAGFYDCRMIGESFQEAEPEAYRDNYNALLTGTPFKMYGMRETSQNPYNIAMAAVCMGDIQVCSGNGAWGDVPDTTETWARVQPFWDVLETVNFDALVEARPWYAQELVGGEGFYAGNYTEPNRALILLANKTEQPGAFDVQIDTSHLPETDGQWHVRYVYGRSGDIGPLGDGRLTVDLPSLRDGPIGLEVTSQK